MLNDLFLLQQNIAITRDQHCYKQLFFHFYNPLTKFAWSIVHSREAAEEIYCDVVLKVWDMGEDLLKVQNLKTYLFKSVKNASLNYLARSNKIKTLQLDDIDLNLLPADQGTGESVYVKELKEVITGAIKNLPPKCQMVYKLIKEYSFTYGETAEILNISVNTVEGHMTTALKKLYISMQSYANS